MKKVTTSRASAAGGRCGQGLYLPQELGPAMTRSVSRIALQARSGCLALHSAPVERTVD